MATRLASLRSSSSSSMVRSFATSAKPSHHNDHRQNHKFLEPNSFLGSWQAPKDPKEAEAKLAMLRRDYAKQVKEVRKQSIREMELLQIERRNARTRLAEKHLGLRMRSARSHNKNSEKLTDLDAGGDQFRSRWRLECWRKGGG